jgi:hypothetical protein
MAIFMVIQGKQGSCSGCHMYAATAASAPDSKAQRPRVARVTPGASKQGVYKGQLPSQKLSSSLLSLVSSISAVYKTDLLSHFVRAVTLLLLEKMQ